MGPILSATPCSVEELVFKPCIGIALHVRPRLRAQVWFGPHLGPLGFTIPLHGT